MTQIAGPYCINFTRNRRGAEIHVCGRYGKIIQRFPATEAGEAEAQALRNQLSGPRQAAAPSIPRTNQTERFVIANVIRRGGSFTIPGLGDPVKTAAAKGLLTIETIEGGYRVSVTALGEQVAA